jgi:hypothetical protein
LEERLNRIAEMTQPDRPTIVHICAHGHEVLVGLGGDTSFVQFGPESGRPPYFVTVGDELAEGVASFHLDGVHPTDIPRRCLVPSAEARHIVREFIATGQRPTGVMWEEI